MKDVEYYLNKGFDRKSVTFFAAGRRTIVSVVPQEDHMLLLQFDSGEKQLFDMKPLVKPETVFAFLSDSYCFRRVYLDENSCVSWDKDPDVDSTKVWSNKVDISSDTCYMDSVPV